MSQIKAKWCYVNYCILYLLYKSFNYSILSYVFISQTHISSLKKENKGLHLHNRDGQTLREDPLFKQPYETLQTSHWCDSHTAHMPIQLLLPWINAVHTQSTKLSTQKNMSVTQNKQKTNVKAFQTEKERWLFLLGLNITLQNPDISTVRLPYPQSTVNINSKHLYSPLSHFPLCLSTCSVPFVRWRSLTGKLSTHKPQQGHS